MPRYLSGIQPSGRPHLGNYFGAIIQHIDISKNLADGDSAFYFIADYHALTTLQNGQVLQERVLDIAATYLALGLDIRKAVFFRQSHIPEVTELTWVLNTCTGMGLLERAVSYKDKVDKGLAANVGLFTYPVLMASDILIYDSDIVPVGKDQIQHIEIAQDIATHFNAKYQPQNSKKDEPIQYLHRPTWKLSKNPKVPGVDGEKMSKSYGNDIWIFAEGKELKKAVNSIVTDSRPPMEPKPDAADLTIYQILSLFLTDEEKQDWLQRMITGGEGAPGYGDMKKAIMAKMDEHFGPARERYKYYTTDPQGRDEVNAVLRDGAARARTIAQATLDRCLHACGIRGSMIL